MYIMFTFTITQYNLPMLQLPRVSGPEVTEKRGSEAKT
jgi:hypothetical protein